MTTIVYHHASRTIAVDGRHTNANGDILTDSAVKHKYKGAELWFFTGAVSDECQLIELEHNSKPEIKPDCSAIMTVDGRCFLVTFNGDYCAHTEMTYNYAIGSGYQYAMAAMDFGEDAKGAVEYAKTRDSATGGKVQSYSIESATFADL